MYIHFINYRNGSDILKEALFVCAELKRHIEICRYILKRHGKRKYKKRENCWSILIKIIIRIKYIIILIKAMIDLGKEYVGVYHVEDSNILFLGDGLIGVPEMK